MESFSIFQNNLEDDQCSICLISSSNPVKCKGPCHKIFCIKCAAQAKCVNDRCPHRCSSPFEVQSVQLPLRCPFKPKQCIISIDNQHQLNTHYLLCPFVTQQQKTQMDNKLNYKCNKGHNLTFLPKEGLQIIFGKHWVKDSKIECVSCKDNVICRSICLPCSIKDQLEGYCPQCRVPPCTKTRCPLGHKLKERKKPGRYRFCDLCDVPAKMMSTREVHGFCPCDFDMCGLCYSKMPQTNDKVPMKWSPQKIWPLALVNNDDSQESAWEK